MVSCIVFMSWVKFRSIALVFEKDGSRCGGCGMMWVMLVLCWLSGWISWSIGIGCVIMMSVADVHCFCLQRLLQVLQLLEAAPWGRVPHPWV